MRKALSRTGMLTALGILLMASNNPVPTLENNLTVKNDSVYPNQCNIENTAFKDGETMVYKVYYNWNFVWLDAGEAVFRVREVDGQYHFSVVGTTYKSYEWFYKVYDKYDTYVDKETLLPLVSIRDVQEGKYTLYDKAVFDHKRNVVRAMRGRSKETAEPAEYEIESCMHDILSIIYYARNLNYDQLPEDSKIPIKVFVDQQTWPLRVHYKGKDENKRIRGLGKFRTIQFSPQVVKGQYFIEEDQMNVWVSDDKNRIPLLIETPVSVGSIKAVLKEYNGLRHELTARH